MREAFDPGLMRPTGDDGAGQAFEAVLVGIRDALGVLCAHPLVREDPQAAAILKDMVWALDMEEFDALVDRLGARVRDVLAEKGLRRPRALAQAQGGELLLALGEVLGDEGAEYRGRAMLRL